MNSQPDTGVFDPVKQAFFRISRIVLLAVCAALLLWVLFAPPLLSSDDCRVTARLSGRPVEARLLKPLFMSGVYYINIPEARRYVWFGVSFRRKVVFSPISVRAGWGGVPYIHRDQATGVDLLFAKIEDPWRVEFPADGVRFSNGTLSVVMSKSR